MNFEELLKELIREKGGTPEDYRRLLNVISFHETGGTMDPTTIQRSDKTSTGKGPGRGKYQFEGADGSNRLLTAANRTANYYRQLGKPVPEEILRIQSGDIFDATQLHPELQDTLVLGDLRMKGGLDLKDYISGKLSPEDLWVDHWWSGSKEKRPEQREKFVKDMKRYDAGLQNPQSKQPEFSLTNTEPTTPKQPQKLDFLPNLFKYGGNMYPDGGQIDPKKKPLYVDSEQHPRYKSYQDSLSLYNRFIDFYDIALNTNVGTKEQVAHRYNIEKDPDGSPNFHLVGTNIEGGGKQYMYAHNRNNVNENILPIAARSYVPDSHNNAGTSPFLAEYKKPEQEVRIKPNLDTDVVAYLQSQGQPHSYAERKKRFKEMFPNEDYKGTGDQNIKLLQSIKTGEVPETTTQTKPESKSEIPQGRVQYGYRDKTGAFKRYDLTQDSKSKKAFEEAKKQPGFKIINQDNLTSQSGNQLAFGGHLNNTNTMNDINMFNEGGTHESNPMGGIPQGMGENGQPNTVEQGEGRMGDMIYSDRIPLTEEAIMAVGLPKKFAGKTPAQALAEIEKTFKDRGDRSAQETKKDFADKIAQAQEMIKEQQAQIDQAMAANSQEVPDQMGGQIPPGMEEFMQPEQGMGNLPMEQDGRLQTGMQEQPQMFRYGGKVNKYFSGGNQYKYSNGGDLYNTEEKRQSAIGQAENTLNPEGQISDFNFEQGLSNINASGAVGMGTTALDFGNQIFGKSGINTSGREDVTGQKANVGGMTASGALKGAQAGMALGPWGAAAGAVVGGVAGLIGGGKKKRDLDLANRNNNLMQYAQKNSDFAYGGKINQYRYGGDPDDPRNKLYYPEIDSPTMSSDPMSPPSINPSMNVGFPNQGYYSTADGKTHGSKPSGDSEFGKKLGRVGNSLLRGAPVGMNALQLRKAGQYDKVSPMLNQTRFQPKYMDERSMQNLADSEMNNQIRGISQLGGSEGAVRSSILGAGLNRAKTLGAGMAQAQAQNNQIDMAGQQFNNQITEANLARRIAAEDRTAMNKGAAATNKSRLLAQIGQDLGNIGKENMYKEIAKITGYNWLGEYLKRNPNASPEEVVAEAQKHVAQEPTTTEKPTTEQSTTNAYGGKLKFKRY